MLCQICKKNVTTITIVKVMGINKTELNVCNECAYYLLGNNDFSFSFSSNNMDEILTSLLYAISKYSREDKSVGYKIDLKCPNCGLTYNEFVQTGKLGCNQCYEVFQKQLNALLGRLHGHRQHTGKVPKANKKKFDQLKNIKKLKNELQQVILKEEYERAAELRDQILEEEKRLRITNNEL
ncbi:MAG: UvrB/UvrC motif-containing protein [bacterium]